MGKVIKWQIGTVVQIKEETPKTRSILLKLPDWSPHLAGQHYNLRLTAADGYQAMRSYSVATGVNVKNHIELTVDLVPDGEVSAFVHEILRVGDQLEVRGPIGGYFVWKPEIKKKIILIGGGSGIVPLMSIIRSQSGERDVKLLYSIQSPEFAIYKRELDDLSSASWFDLHYTFTRSQPDDWGGYARRIDHDMVMDLVAGEHLGGCIAYVCGPTAFVEFVANTLKEEGMFPSLIRTERFGPSAKLSLNQRII